MRDGQLSIRHYANLPVPYDFCVGVPISCLLTVVEPMDRFAALEMREVQMQYSAVLQVW